MKPIKKAVLMICIICIATLSPVIGFSQGGSDPGCDPGDPACPIDGGISLLIAAGIGLGAKKAYDKKKQKEAE